MKRRSIADPDWPEFGGKSPSCSERLPEPPRADRVSHQPNHDDNSGPTRCNPPTRPNPPGSATASGRSISWRKGPVIESNVAPGIVMVESLGRLGHDLVL